MITLWRTGQPRRTPHATAGRLASLWSTHITYYPPDGSPSSAPPGHGSSLRPDGRAVIDVWQVPGRDTLAGAPRPADQECGLCVRIWDPGLQLWRFTFHGTAHGHLIHMYARQINDDIVMEQAQGGDLIRWIFSDIRPESFRWRSQRSTDGGTLTRNSGGPTAPPQHRSRRSFGDEGVTCTRHAEYSKYGLLTPPRCPERRQVRDQGDDRVVSGVSRPTPQDDLNRRDSRAGGGARAMSGSRRGAPPSLAGAYLRIGLHISHTRLRPAAREWGVFWGLQGRCLDDGHAVAG
jgi:hypothetical protein